MNRIKVIYKKTVQLLQIDKPLLSDNKYNVLPLT